MAMAHRDGPDPASFRDPAGFIFYRGGEIFRQVNRGHAADYDRLMQSGLYAELVREGLLIPHEEMPLPPESDGEPYRILKPQPVPFVSYPYEWCFSQLKEAALVTLAVLGRALAHGMILKDASAFNIQFVNGRAVFIDTLSFTAYRGGAWLAYAQFCRHFAAPLALMSGRDHRLGVLLREFIDGVPLDLASGLLPRRSWFDFFTLTHVHGHARAQRTLIEGRGASGHGELNATAVMGIADHLEGGLRRLKLPPQASPWVDYAQTAPYTREAQRHKGEIVRSCVERGRPGVVWDVGCNSGEYSRIAAQAGAEVVGWDADVHAVEAAHTGNSADPAGRCLFLCADFLNPSPPLGWAHTERLSLAARGPAGLVMGLGLLHHLAVTGNVPFAKIAAYWALIAKTALIEFIPPEDAQARQLIARQEGIPGYTQADFERAFGEYFNLEPAMPLHGSGRVLYFMTSKGCNSFDSANGEAL